MNLDLRHSRLQVLLHHISIFVFIVLLSSTVSALQFSPTSLEFNLEKNQISCGNVNFEIESSATVQDFWAQDSSKQWSISQFKTSSEEHGITASYPFEINPEQDGIQVCVSGSKPGDYRGALVFRQEEVGNSIVQFAVWLKLSVSGKADEQPQEEKPRSSHRSASGSIIWASEPTTKPSHEKTQELTFNIPQEEIKLSSQNSKTAFTKETQMSINQILLIIFPMVIIIILLLFLLIRKH